MLFFEKSVGQRIFIARDFIIKTKDHGLIGMVPIGLQTVGSVVFEDGIKNARARGRKGGRPRSSEVKVKEALALYHAEEFSLREITNKTGISTSTLYRRLKEEESSNGKN